MYYQDNHVSNQQEIENKNENNASAQHKDNIVM